MVISHLFNMPKLKIRENFIFILTLCLLIILPYFFSIGLNKDLVLGSPNGDMAYFFIPIRSFGFSLPSKGTLPLWNPYIFSGTPFLAESQLAIFYPFNLIHLFLPISLAVNLLIILHQVLAGVFMYLYLKRLTLDGFSSLVGAMIFALSSAFITRIFIGHLTIICAITWIPLLFFCIDKALSKESNLFIILAGFVLSLQLLSGHIQFVFITLIGLFLYLAYASFANYRARQSTKEILYPFYVLIAVAIFGIGISAIQTLPSWELMRQALRFKNPIFNYKFSMPPENIMTILSPGFWGWIKNGIYWGKWYPWEASIYVGILPLLLSFFAVIKADKYSRFFAGLFLFSLILSFGAYIPIYRHLYKYMTSFNLFRANGRFLILGVFSLSVLASLGCRALSYSKTGKSEGKSIFVIFFGLVLIFILASLRLILIYLPLLGSKITSFIISYDELSTKSGLNFGYLFNPATIYEIVISSLNKSIVMVLLSILLFILYIKCFLKENLRKFLIAAFIIVDLWGFGAEYFSVFPYRNSYLDNKTMTFLQDNIGQNRYLPLGISFRNVGMIDKISSIGGYSGCLQGRYNEFINFTQGRPLDAPFIMDPIRRSSRLFELLNLKYILVNGYIETNSSYFKQVYNNRNWRIYQNPISLSKAFIVHKAVVIRGRDDIFKTLSDTSFNFKDTVILEEPFNLAMVQDSASIDEPAPVITTYLPNSVVIKADVKASGYLVLCDNYYSGWKAYVDGKITPILKANYILRAVALPSGTHTIKFIYSPASLKIGFFITLLFLILGIIIFTRHFAKRK